MAKTQAPTPAKKKKINYAKIQERLEFTKKRFTKESVGAEGFLMTCHIIRDGRITHSWEYENFPNGDWPTIVMAMAVEGKRAQLIAATSQSKI